MSALAAIDTAVKCLDGYWWAVAEADGLEDARAAVAELVEAHRNALAALDVLMEGWPKGAPVPAGWDSCCSAYDAGHAALAPFTEE